MRDSIVMNQISYNLDDILKDCWHRLINATLNAKHPFRTPTIASLNDNVPELRTVVLRKVIPNETMLEFYTDFRSPKINQIKKCNVISWLFYDPKSKLQIRIKTKATIHYKDDVAQKKWDDSRLESRKCYLVQPAPSTMTLVATDGLPENFKNSELTNDNTTEGFNHFAVIKNKVIEIDWLLLNQEGHRRAKFLINDDTVEKSWIIP